MPPDDQAAASRAASPASTARDETTISASTGDDLSWLGPIYFSFDSAVLSDEARATLARLHDWMMANPAATITVEGHTDEQGTTEYNIALGLRRAQVIADYLARLGTPKSRIATTSYGEERPAIDGSDESAWAKNRRGELRTK